MSDETPYALAQRLHREGLAADAVEAALRERGLSEEDARVAARAGRGEAGHATPVVVDVPTPPALPVEPPKDSPSHPCPKHDAWPVRATCVRCGAFFCAKCITDAGLKVAPASKQCPDCEVKFPVAVGPAGIGGWLLLPALQLVVTPLNLVATFINDLTALSENTDFVAPVVIEAVLSLLLLGYSVVTGIHFFGRRRRAVPLMLGFYAATWVYSVLDALLGDWVAALAATEGAAGGNGAHVLRGGGFAVVWFAYFLQSKRVKATFTR